MSDATPPAEDNRPDADSPEPLEPQGQPQQPEVPQPQAQPAQPSGEAEPPSDSEVGGDEQPAMVIPLPEPPPETPEEEEQPNVVARYGLMRHIGAFRCNWKELPELGDKVVLRTERGVELGEVLIRVSPEPGYGCIPPERLEAFISANGPEYPFRQTGKVLRRANEQDLIDYRHLETSAIEESAFCQEQIRQLKLEMKMVAAEHLLGGERIIFYFTAEDRVDFRELVKHLAGEYHTRIELRQVGARDEARLVADYERCGRRCCCQAFIKNLQPVSMRMAKMQKATLDPAKISGRCGRLMCCLRYEDAGYEELRRRLPRKNTYVRTSDYVGRVVDVNILTQLVALVLPDERRVAVGNEDIIERDIAPEMVAAKTAEVEALRRARPAVPAVEAAAPEAPREAAEIQRAEAPEPAAAPQPQPAAEAQQRPKKRRRRRRGKKRRQPQPQQQQGQPSGGRGPQTQGGAQSPSSGKRRRRRRKRRKDRQGGGPGVPSSPSGG